ncbi:MAG: hypothetical protein JSV44_02800 [Candidatus Zixiibacteriota bacterium]|nr:MAG: hypothetical protein JSV44_02800 [candidate division Zixibacteria bacterium]
MIDRIGQLFIVGFDGEIPSTEFLEFFSSQQPGGVILFEENCNPHGKAEESLRRITSKANIIPFVAVDQEGGRVCRFRGAPAEYGAASAYGGKYNLELYSEQFSRAAYYLRAAGVNLLLGPVADLQLNDDNRCLKGRTFGRQSAKVMPFVEKTIKLARKAGLLTCVKHFPGLGASKDDPHEGVAVGDYDFQTFLNREAFTFQAAVRAGCEMVMTTHLSLPLIDKTLATASQVVVEKMLRETLTFDGIVVTDDLLMKGADQLGSYGERAVQAFQAGHDILLFGRNFRAAREAISHFKQAFQKGQIDENHLGSSLDRIAGIKSKLMVSVL